MNVNQSPELNNTQFVNTRCDISIDQIKPTWFIYTLNCIGFLRLMCKIIKWRYKYKI